MNLKSRFSSLPIANESAEQRENKNNMTASHSSDSILGVKLRLAASARDLRRLLRYADRYLKDFAILDYKQREAP